MLNKIIDYSLQNRLMVLFISILIFLSGVYISTQLDIDIFPDLNAPTVVVMTEAPGMAPEEVEQMVSFPIETAVNGSAGIRRIRSSSAMGFSIVWVEFNWNVDIYEAHQTVSEKLMVAKEQLPKAAGEPVLAPQSSLMGEIIIFSISSDSLSQMDLRTFADWEVRPRLLSVGGVAQVTTLGGEYREYQIQPDPLKMNYYQVSLTDILSATEGMNVNVPGGFINQNGKKYIVRGMARTSQAEAIGQVVVGQRDGSPVKLSDVANVEETGAPKIGVGSYNAERAVVMTITKQPDINTINLTEKIDEELALIEKNTSLPVTIHEPAYKQASFIQRAVNNVIKVLLEGSVFVVLILFIFLFNFRTTVISLVAIPVSLLVSVMALKMMGLTINTMSLGGLAIAIGSLVDDAIIDVENVFKRLRQNAGLPKEDQKSNIKVIYKASTEIRASILNATLIIIVAFVPLFFLTGFEGRMLRPLGISYIVALFASLVVAITLTPVLCNYLLTNKKLLLRTQDGSWVERKLTYLYERLLTQALRHKTLLVSIAVGLFLSTLLLFFTYGRSFLPPFNEGSLTINVATTPETNLQESDAIGRQAEQELLSLPEVQTTLRKTGRAELAEHSFGQNVSEIEVPFELDERSRSEFLEEVRDKLKSIPGAVVSVGQPITHRIDHMLSGSKANIAIKIFGHNLSEMYNTAKEMETFIKEVPGVADVSVEQQVEVPQLKIIPRYEMLARYGISIPEFNAFIEVLLNGKKVSDVFDREKSFDMVVRLETENRSKIEEIGDILIDSKRDGKIPLSYVADIRSSYGPNTINRENVERKLMVNINVGERDAKSVVKDIKETLNQNAKVPDGMRVVFSGQFESADRASAILLFTSLIAILFIFLLLYQEFRNTQLSLIILLNLPMALIGGVLVLFISSQVISIPAIIGFITLFGIATRNGILLISRYRHLEVENYGLYERVVKGSIDRLTPILMTALTAALALIPLALAGNQPGNEIQSPMAKVILGGLISSTLLNIFIIPIVYYLLNMKKERS